MKQRIDVVDEAPHFEEKESYRKKSETLFRYNVLNLIVKYRQFTLSPILCGEYVMWVNRHGEF